MSLKSAFTQDIVEGAPRKRARLHTRPTAAADDASSENSAGGGARKKSRLHAPPTDTSPRIRPVKIPSSLPLFAGRVHTLSFCVECM